MPDSDARHSLPLILASGSPRRRDLLAEANVAFEVDVAGIEEHTREGERPTDLARRLACEKALAVASRRGAPPRRWVLGADTIVVVDEDVLGKPDDPDHALVLLRRIRGRRHRVITGVCLAESETLSQHHFAVESRVTMQHASDDELRRYIATGEPLDKAGAYALQGEGGRFVAAVEGSRSNVIGLPVEETLALLRDLGAGASRPAPTPQTASSKRAASKQAANRAARDESP